MLNSTIVYAPQDILVSRYRIALRAWAKVATPVVADLISRYDYCNRMVAGMPPISWTATNASPCVEFDPARAYADACALEGMDPEAGRSEGAG